MTTEEYGEKFKTGFPLTVRFLLSKGVPRDLAKELAQAAWTRGFERQHQLAREEYLFRWVNSIARNFLRDLQREDQKILPDALTEQIADTKRIGLSDKSLDSVRLLSLCQSSDARLLLQRYALGLSVEEVAELNNISIGNVRVRVHRAIRLIRKSVPCK